MDLTPWFLVLGFLALVAWLSTRPQGLFEIHFIGGKPRVVRGVVTPRFLVELEEVCRGYRVERGMVRGVARGRRIALVFGNGFPPAACQVVRNLWGQHSWSPPPTSPQRRLP